MTQMRTALEVFCSYAEADKALFEKLQRHLSALQKQRLISLWHPHQIGAGTAITPEILAHLKSASVILLLISDDFLASDQQYNVEMEPRLSAIEPMRRALSPSCCVPWI